MSGRVADLILSTRNLAEGSWCYFRELGERVTPKGSYRRKEDAIEAGRKQAQKSKWQPLYIGRAVKLMPDWSIDTYQVLDDIADDFDAEYHLTEEEYDRLKDNFTDSDIELLEQKLQNAMREWLAEIKWKPTQSAVVDVEKIEI